MKNMSKQAAKTRLVYARRYHHILESGVGQELLNLTFNKRTNAMRSLAILSKYLGAYSRWRSIKEAYALRWSNDTDGGISLFNEITSGSENYTIMMAWLKQAVAKLEERYGQVLVYATLTGLRASECCKSLQLLRNGAPHYRNDKDGTIEHFRFPVEFIRKTKRAYVSIMTPEILEVAERADASGSYNALRLAGRRLEMPVNMKFCRKLFGTYLRMKGVQTETVDLLQGRIGRSIFLRNYYRPDFEQERNRIRGLLGELLKEIID